MDDLKTVIDQFLSLPSDQQMQSQLNKALWAKILDAVEWLMQHGSSIKSPVSSEVFRVGYRDRNEPRSTIPDYVKWRNVEEDFSDAMEKLHQDLFGKIHKSHEVTIKMLKGTEQERNKWILSTLGLVCNNRVFNMEIEEESLSEDLPNSEDDDWSVLDRKWELEDEITSQKKWREEAFFWIPGQLFQEKDITKKYNVSRTIYIAFFYAWLRTCSHATSTEVAREIGVRTSNVSRDWKPHPILEEPFHVQAWDVMHPVYFSRESRTSLGMYDTKIRCYRGSYGEKQYEPINKRKRILWRIYEILINGDTLDLMTQVDDLRKNHEETIVLQEKKLKFSYQMTYSHKIGLKSKKTPKRFIYITSIEVS